MGHALFERTVADFGRRPTVIRVGVLPASAGWLLPRALMLFKHASPKSSITVREATMDVLLGELRLG